MARIEKLNKAMLKETANLIKNEIESEDFLITVTYAKFSTDLTQLKLGISILPENKAGNVLKKLRQKSQIISKTLKNKYNLRLVPFLKWEIDTSHLKIFELDKILNKK